MAKTNNELNDYRAAEDRADNVGSEAEQAARREAAAEDASARAAEDLETGTEQRQDHREDSQGGGQDEDHVSEADPGTKSGRRAAIAAEVRAARDAEQQAAMGAIDGGGQNRQQQNQSGADGEGQRSNKPYRIETGEDGIEYGVLKINGQDVRRPMEKIFETAQKVTAGDQRLERASAAIRTAQGLYADINRREADLTAREQQLADLRKKVTKDGSQLSTEDVADVDKHLGRVMDALLDDDKEAAAAALKDALRAGRGDAATPAMTDAEAGNVVDTEMAATRQRQHQVPAEITEAITADWNDARTNFMTEHPDIKPGSRRWELAAQYSKTIGEEPEFKNKGFNAIFREAGKRVREFYGDDKQQQQRLERKIDSQQHVPQRNGVGGGQQQRRQEAPPVKSQFDKVMDMRRKRRPNEAY